MCFIYKELQTTQLKRMNSALARFNVHINTCTVLDILNLAHFIVSLCEGNSNFNK